MRARTVLRTALAIVAAIGICWLGGCTVNPVTGKKQLDLMGEAQEIRLGADLYPQYTESSLGAVHDPALQDYLQRVGDKLGVVSHRPRLPYGFNGVNDPVVNAYALPGGKISITRGLLARFENEDQLAGVLAHEIGHVTARHSAQQYTRAMLVQALLIGGEIYMDRQGTRNRNLYRYGGLIGAQLVMARYSRENERQADDLGMQYMTAAGYNPNGMVEVMEILQAQHTRKPNLVERMFASHPLTAERIATARQGVSQQPPNVANRRMKQVEYQRMTSQIRRAKPAYDRLAEARGLLAEDKTRQARKLLRQSADEWPNDGVLRSYLAVADHLSGSPRQALSNAERAAGSSRDIFFVQMLAGQIFLEEERYRKSLQYFDQAETVLPKMVGVTLLRGRAYEGMGQRNSAVAAYRQVMQMAPGSEAAQTAEQRLQALGVATNTSQQGTAPRSSKGGR